MCRNIRVLHAFEPPTTLEEMRAAALQYVRKVCGLNTPSAADERAFQQAVDEVAASTEKLLRGLTERATKRTRDGERKKARARWTARTVRLAR